MILMVLVGLVAAVGARVEMRRSTGRRTDAPRWLYSGPAGQPCDPRCIPPNATPRPAPPRPCGASGACRAQSCGYCLGRYRRKPISGSTPYPVAGRRTAPPTPSTSRRRQGARPARPDRGGRPHGLTLFCDAGRQVGSPPGYNLPAPLPNHPHAIIHRLFCMYERYAWCGVSIPFPLSFFFGALLLLPRSTPAPTRSGPQQITPATVLLAFADHGQVGGGALRLLSSVTV